MSFQREQWLTFFYWTGDQPAWPCRCGRGKLRLKNPVALETTESKDAHDLDDWAPEWNTYRVRGDLVCDGCKDQGFVCGQATLEREEDDETGENYVKKVNLYYLDPAPEMFPIPEACPPKVRELLLQAFELYWKHPSAAGARARAALEALLDAQRIARVARKKGAKNSRLTLHTRIELFKSKSVSRERIANRLMAVKWIGNNSAHESIEHEDVLDGIELLDSALNLLYVKNEENLDKKAKKIISRKGKKPKR